MKKSYARVEDIHGMAAALYDGGWRAADRDDLITEYSLTPEDADSIVEFFSDWEVGKLHA